MPRTSCGASDGVRVFDAWPTAGAGSFTAVEALVRRVCRLPCLQARRPLRSPAGQISMPGLPGCMARPRPAQRARGLGLAFHLMDHGSDQYLSDPLHLHQIKLLGHPAVLTPFVAEPHAQRRRRAVAPARTLKPNRSIHACASTATSRSCGTAVRDFGENVYNAKLARDLPQATINSNFPLKLVRRSRSGSQSGPAA